MSGYAGLVSRGLAYLIDAVAVALLAGAGVTVLGMVASVVGPEARDLARLVVSGYVLFLPALLAVYCALFWSLAGRTPGMAVVGVRVVRTDGRPVGWLGASIRGVLLAFFPIGALWLLIDRRRQAVHDKVVGTYVVRVG